MHFGKPTRPEARLRGTDAALVTLLVLEYITWLAVVFSWVMRRRVAWIPGSMGRLQSIAISKIREGLITGESRLDRKRGRHVRGIVDKLPDLDPIRYGTQQERLSIAVDPVVRALRHRKATTWIGRSGSLRTYLIMESRGPAPPS